MKASQYWPSEATLLAEFSELKRKMNLILRVLLQDAVLSEEDRQAIREELKR